MNRYVFSLLLIIFASLRVGAQENIRIGSFSELENDARSRTWAKLDKDGNRTAIIIVNYPVEGVEFGGDFLIKDLVEFKNGQYRVYMYNGATSLEIRIPNVPTITLDFKEYGINKVKGLSLYLLELKTVKEGIAPVFYVEAGYAIGGECGAEIALGTYFGGINAELDFAFPLVEKQSTYWYDKDNNTPVADNGSAVLFDYKPSFCFGARLGYGIKLGKRFRITPQLGFREMIISETVNGKVAQTPSKGANCGSIEIDTKVQFFFNKHFCVSLVPLYSLHVAKSKGFKELTSVSTTIGKWNKGFSCKLGLSIEF